MVNVVTQRDFIVCQLIDERPIAISVLDIEAIRPWFDDKGAKIHMHSGTVFDVADTYEQVIKYLSDLNEVARG